MSVSQAKSNLARLLAAENIIVEQRKVSTAFFDTSTRLLVLPTFKEDLSADVTDLLISHECAHALFTPNAEWNDALSSVRKSLLNVVEDARIERKIKHRYPGLRPIYSRAYRELMASDFFGLVDLDVEKLNLIDRINLYFKVGFIPGLEFTKEEQVFVDKVEAVTTFEEVVGLAKEIETYMTAHPTFVQKPIPLDLGVIDIDISDLDFDSIPPEEKFGADEVESNVSSDGGKEDKEEEEKDEEEVEDEDADEEENEPKGSLGGLPEQSEEEEEEELEEEEIESFTDIASNDAMEHLINNEYKDSVYVDVPPIKTDMFTVPYSTIYRRLEPYNGYVDKTAFNTFRSETNPIVTYLVKEFLLKKNASGRKKAKVSKTGDINMSKLFSYKISEDIFKKSTRVPNEQSHGLVFFLDWSGSMGPIMNDTIKQLITMLLFCKKLNIPFEVYAFTSNYRDENGLANTYSVGPLNTILGPLRLMNLFSSKMKQNEFNHACNLLLSLKHMWFGYYTSVPGWFSLGDTPLNHTILVSPELIKEFKETAKVEVVNAIYLTDGESHQVKYSHNGGSYHVGGGSKRTYLRNKTEKITRKIKSGYSNETDECLKFIKEFTDFRIFGFRLITRREVQRKSFYEPEDFMKKFNKENCAEKSNTGYDKYYYIKTNTIGEEESLDVKENDSVASITRKFSKSFTNKINNRVFLKKFIEFIS